MKPCLCASFVCRVAGVSQCVQHAAVLWRSAHRNTHNTFTEEKKEKKKRKLSFNEVNNTRHILSYFYYTLPLDVTTSPQFSLLYYGAAYEWREMHNTETNTHAETEATTRRAVLQLERGRYMCHTCSCDAMWTLSHTFTQSYPISHAKYHAYLQRKFTTHTQTKLMSDMRQGGIWSWKHLRPPVSPPLRSVYP